MARASVLLGLALAQGAEAWGVDGHAAIAVIADSLVSPEVNKALMEDLGQEALEQAAIWPDDYDHSPAGKWSEPLHFINYPGHACSFDWARDCVKDFCNVGWISNNTQQIWDKSISKENRLTALKFVIHMMGDVHQPLHVASNDDRGGNDIHIDYKFTDSGEFKSKNLHSIWDDGIVVQMIDDLSARALRGGPPPFHKYKLIADDLTKRIKGEWSSNATTWKAVVAEKRDDAELRKGLTVVAGETAALGCEYAYASVAGPRIVEGDKLDVQYYQSRKPIVAMQLARGGVRLAQLLSDSLLAARAKESVIFA